MSKPILLAGNSSIERANKVGGANNSPGYMYSRTDFMLTLPFPHTQTVMSIHPLFLPSSFTWSNPVPTVLQLQYKTHLLTLGKPTKTILIDLDQTIIRSRAKFPSKDPKDWTYINEHVKRTLRKYAGVMQGGTEKKVHETNGKRRREEGDSSVAQKDMQEEVKSKCPKTETATQDKQAKRASETQEATSATSPGKEALDTGSSTEEIDTGSTDHYNIIIITNQGGHKVQSRQVTWKKKCELICKDVSSFWINASFMNSVLIPPCVI